MFQAIRDRLFPQPQEPQPLTCEHCGHDEFISGPEGGIYEMIECNNCGKAFLWDGYTAKPNPDADYELSGRIFDRKLEQL